MLVVLKRFSEPLEFIKKLAALFSRPRVHLTRFHGVFASNTKHRKLIVPRMLWVK
ncbi:MAG: transposase [Bdellovibrionales bacterium]|nr:transposase [Bdellovibrionales bacterium]